MKQKEKDLFSVRLRIAGGSLTAEVLEKLAGISREYGRGNVHLTTRQGVEIPYVHFDDFGRLREALEDAGLDLGTCGPRVRTVTACQGEICTNGLIDSQRIGAWIDEKFYGEGGLPHKFKIAVAGCPNSCVKTRENDLGIQGVVKVSHYPEECNLCGICVGACPVNAIGMDMEGIQFDREKCVGCNDCVMVCPCDAWAIERRGFAIYAGSKMGKFPKLGVLAWPFITGEEHLESVIRESIDFYRRVGKRGERFRDTLDRFGFGAYIADVEEHIWMDVFAQAGTARAGQGK